MTRNSLNGEDWESCCLMFLQHVEWCDIHIIINLKRIKEFSSEGQMSSWSHALETGMTDMNIVTHVVNSHSWLRKGQRWRLLNNLLPDCTSTLRMFNNDPRIKCEHFAGQSSIRLDLKIFWSLYWIYFRSTLALTGKWNPFRGLDHWCFNSANFSDDIRYVSELAYSC